MAASVVWAAALAVAAPLSPYDADADGDLVPDHSDNCPLIANPTQLDADADADGDACDCAPAVVGVSASPSAIGSTLRLSGTTVTWARPAQGHLFNVYRGTIDGTFVANESCFAGQLLQPASDDPEKPAAGSALYYLVSTENRCGESPDAHPAAVACAGINGDRDSDGALDLDDNCASAANPTQLDQDHDFRGDACDLCRLDPTDDHDGDNVCATTRGPLLAWIDSTVYVLIPGKFDNGDLTNDYMKNEYSLPNPAYEGGFLGGDLQGALNRLGYVQSLGLNTVLMYPPFANDQHEFFSFLPTGYRVENWQQVDRNFGSKQQLRQFIDALHSGTPAMRFIIDLPIGMAGIEHPWNTRQLEFVDYFRPWGTENIGSEPAQTAYGPVDNSFGMAIINHLKGRSTYDQTYKVLVDDVMIWLSREYGVDGIRYDSVHNFYTDFWSSSVNDFRRRVNRVRPDTTQFGEWAWLGPLYSWQRAEHEFVNTASPTGIRMTGIYDFSMISDIRQVFGKSVHPNLLVFNHDSRKATFEDPRVLAASVDNYEADSFLKAVTDGRGKQRLKLALALLFSIDRVPFVYSGNEYGIDYTLPGTLFQSGLDTAFHQWFKQLVQIRATRPTLRHAAVTWLTRNASYLSFARRDADGTLITALAIDNRSNRQETLNIGAAGITCSSVSNLIDPADTGNQLLGSGASQTLRITHDPWEPKILLCQP